jgi:hypothetical protein
LDVADAVRFCISHDRDGLIRISWVMEKDHLPFAPHPDVRVTQQARAYISSYLRRIEDSGRP